MDNEMINSFRSRLGDARRAPKQAAKDTKTTTKETIRLAAASVIEACLDGQAGGFGARKIFEAVPEFAARYDTANVLGTALGDGVRGSGLGLHRDAEGKFRRCRDNGAAAAELREDEIDDLAAELGFRDADGLADAINQLPSALVGS